MTTSSGAMTETIATPESDISHDRSPIAASSAEGYEMVTIPQQPDNVSDDLDEDIREEYARRFPGIADPRQILRLFAQWNSPRSFEDHPDLALCLRLVYPDLVKARNEVLAHFRQLCEFGSMPCEPETEDFWPDVIRRFNATWKWARYRDFVPLHPGLVLPSCAEWTVRADETHQYITPLRLACSELEAAMAQVEEQLAIMPSILEHLAKLNKSLDWLEERFATHIEQSRASEQRAAAAGSAGSSTLTGTDGRHVKGFLEPQPGIRKTDSSSSGIFMPPPATARHRAGRHRATLPNAGRDPILGYITARALSNGPDRG